ncbi:hypothetical protein [Peribacillus muralis]|uniref:hypothetical protein n=1 Tax=Peribacillus muralis TaxID=264697 RepID=UPI003D079AD6
MHNSAMFFFPVLFLTKVLHAVIVVAEESKYRVAYKEMQIWILINDIAAWCFIIWEYHYLLEIHLIEYS